MGREGMRASVMARSLLVVRSEGSGMGQDVIGWTVSLIIDWWGGGGCGAEGFRCAQVQPYWYRVLYLLQVSLSII